MKLNCFTQYLTVFFSIFCAHQFNVLFLLFINILLGFVHWTKLDMHFYHFVLCVMTVVSSTAIKCCTAVI